MPSILDPYSLPEKMQPNTIRTKPQLYVIGLEIAGAHVGYLCDSQGDATSEITRALSFPDQGSAERYCGGLRKRRGDIWYVPKPRQIERMAA